MLGLSFEQQQQRPHLPQLLHLILMLVLPARRFSILLGCCPPLLPCGLCQLPVTLLLHSQALLHMLQLLHTHTHTERHWMAHHCVSQGQLHLCWSQLLVCLLLVAHRDVACATPFALICCK